MNVYCITFPNQKKYVGIEGITGTRRGEHSRSKNRRNSTLVGRAIRKYGWENCSFEYVAMNESPDYCYALEIELIAHWRLQHRDCGYNRSSGGEQGFRGVTMSLQHREKIGRAHKGKTISIETRELLRNINTGKILSDEHKQKIAASLTGRPGNFTGHKHSDAAKQRISKAVAGVNNPFYGKQHPVETRAKMTAAWKRRREQSNAS